MRCERCYGKVRVRHNISLITFIEGDCKGKNIIARFVCTTCKKDIIREMKRLIGDRLI